MDLLNEPKEGEMGYEESKYYERQFELLEKHLDGKISEEELNEKLLQALDEELAHPEIYGDWLVSHYNSAAEPLCDNAGSMEGAEKMFSYAMKEAEVFRKNGYGDEADSIIKLAEEGLDFWKNEFGEA